MLSDSLSDLAKVNVRDTMRAEIELNQDIINHAVLHRNSPRFDKIDVFTAMARNEMLRYFLSLDPDKQVPSALYVSLPMSEEYKALMYRLSSTKYAYSVKADAERQLLRDYTHVDYKYRLHFLDEALPQKPQPFIVLEKILNATGMVISFCLEFWWALLIIFIFIAAWMDDSSYPSNVGSGSSGGYSSSSSGSRSTFGSGGVAGGNPDEKRVSDSPQVKDGSGQAGFGNRGDSGRDAVGSSAGSNQSSSNNRSGIQESVVPISDQSVELSKDDTSKPVVDGAAAHSNQNESTTVDKRQPEDGVIDEEQGFAFTLGSTQEFVRLLMGESKSIIGFTWGYGYSNVYFDAKGMVNGWSNIDGNLLVSLGSKKEHAPPFGIGSKHQDVIDAMGTPSSLIGGTWRYKNSAVYFDAQGKVDGWSNIDGNLIVSMGSKKDNAPPFGIGSSDQDVIDAMGTPSTLIGDTWRYKNSAVYFDAQGKVDGWSNIDGNLSVSLGSKKDDAPPFGIGSSYQDVIDAMGTPSSLIGDTWRYGYSAVYFDAQGKVSGRSDSSEFKTE